MRDLVTFTQIKKREKHSWKSVCIESCKASDVRFSNYAPRIPYISKPITQQTTEVSVKFSSNFTNKINNYGNKENCSIHLRISVQKRERTNFCLDFDPIRQNS